jgi:hypothetical protein
MLIYVRCNLDLVNRAVDHTSSNAAAFVLDEDDSDDEDDEEIPDAWRIDDDDDDDDDGPPAGPPVAAVARSEVRREHVQKNKDRVPALSAAAVAAADKEEAEAIKAGNDAPSVSGGGRVRRPKKILDM